MIGRMDRRDFIATGMAAGTVAALDVGAVAAQEAGEPVVYFNGFILTMEGDTVEYAEAVAVRDGRIAFVGPRDRALSAVGDARQIDLEGRTMVPGFIDSWAHFMLFAQQTLGVNLSYFADKPPQDKADVIALLKAATPFNGWIIGHGYIDALLSDGAPTLADLDAAFPDQPVMMCNLSTLTGKVNSAGLAKLGITPDTKAAQPGEIVKDPKTGKLTGDLLFTPLLQARAVAIGTYPQETAFKTFQAAEALLAKQGLTTVQSYQLVPSEIATLRAAFDAGVLSLDVIGLPVVSDDASGKIVQSPDWKWGAYSHGDHGLKIPGYQVATDAAPQLRLAAFTQPYLDTTGFPDGWKGMLLPAEGVEKWVAYAYAQGIQLYMYSNGDAGIDLSLSAIAKAVAASGQKDDRRTVIAHSYFVRQDQLAQYKAQGIGASMMPPHMMLYGDQLRTYLGPERADLESPLQSALMQGLNTTLHCDYPSASPNMLEAIGAAVTRTTMVAGTLMGPQERLEPYTALLAATRNVARTYRDEAVKGTITAGKIADLVILDANPLTVAPEKIRDIKVVETIKRGRTIYQRG
jgi:predicted amidohydrolase YtcJ